MTDKEFNHLDCKERGKFLKEIETDIYDLLDGNSEYVEDGLQELYSKVLNFNENN